MIETNKFDKIKFDNDLSKLASYLTFDGHLAEDLKCFYLCSKNKSTLLDFERIAFRKFLIKGRLENGMGHGESYKYRIFSGEICRFLEEIGVPKGNKVAKSFLVPDWIKSNKEFSRFYLRTAFDCEGSIWFEKKPKIRFGIYKTEGNLENGLEFIEEIKNMLSIFNVHTTNTWLIKGNLREDGKITKGIYFKVKQSSLSTFASQIGFNDRFKNKRLILAGGARA